MAKNTYFLHVILYGSRNITPLRRRDCNWKLHEMLKYTKN